MELNQLTIQEAREGLKKEKFSSEELTKACLRQVKKLDKKINAFITVCEKEALEQAREADKIKSDKPLWGIPIGIKDIYSTRGVKTTAGARVLDDYIPVYDATAVKRLKEVGAIVLGKTNMDAWAHGASGENSDYGPTKNPWNLEYVPGGSSSGSGAALASAMCLAATGTDTGGSIRQPASFCNLVGLKPTYGRVSRYGIIAMASSLDSIGHITKTVYDNALILNITAGQDDFDSTASLNPVDNYTKDIEKGVKGLKIGLPKEYFDDLDSNIKNLIISAVKILEKKGAIVIDVSLPHTKYGVATYYIIQTSEVSSNLARYDGIRFGQQRQLFGAEAKRRIILGTYTLSAGYYDAYYLKAMKVRRLIRDDYINAFKIVDILICPTSPTLPFKIGQKANDPLDMYLSDIFVVTQNLAGVPSLNVPCGFINGLPV